MCTDVREISRATKTPTDPAFTSGTINPFDTFDSLSMEVCLNAVFRARQNAAAEDRKKKHGLSVEGIYRYTLIVSLHFRDYAIFAEEQNILTYGLCTLKARYYKGIPILSFRRFLRTRIAINLRSV